MRSLALVALVALAPLPAHAEDWSKRCVAIIGAARAELMTSDPLFKGAKVGSDVKGGTGKQPITGDPAKRPIVSFSLGSLGSPASGARTPLYLATVSAADANADRDRTGWTPIPNKTYSGFDLRERRTLGGRAAFIGGRDVTLPRLQRFIDRFRRAADDCLALSAPSAAPRSSPARPSP